MTGRGVAGAVVALAACATAGATGWEWVYPQPRGGDLHAVISTQDGFVAVGDGGTILHSSDGIDWQLVSVAAGADLQGVATDGAVIVAVGDSGTIVRGTLSDPTWRRASPTTDADLDDVACGHGSWLAVGDTGTILTSTDGVAWTGHRFVAVGRYGLVAISEDGTGWTRLPFRLDLDLRRVASDGDIILVAGDARIGAAPIPRRPSGPLPGRPRHS